MENASEQLVHTSLKYKQKDRDVQVIVMERDGQPVFQCLVDGKFVLDLTMNDAGCWQSANNSEPELSQAIGEIIEQKTM